jgi:hypothetical protein
MKNRQNLLAYNQAEIDRYGQLKTHHHHQSTNSDSLKGIALPAKIKCGRCQKNLPQVKFSMKQLTDARWQIKNSSKVYKPINCHNCTGQQVVEVECTMCGKTKGLEDFAKSQRRNPDTAKCFKCVEAQLANEAFDEEKYEDPDKAFAAPDHSNGQYPEYFSAATTDTSSFYVSLGPNFTPFQALFFELAHTDFTRARMTGRPSARTTTLIAPQPRTVASHCRRLSGKACL